jgi:hypothetical protein
MRIISAAPDELNAVRKIVSSIYVKAFLNFKIKLTALKYLTAHILTRKHLHDVSTIHHYTF